MTKVHPLLVQTLGRVCVIAPHPDDEAIGCGGLIALLRRQGAPVFVLLLSDGEMSHPGSLRWPPGRRAALRRAEFAASLAALDVDLDAAATLGWPDGALPQPGDTDFKRAVTCVTRCLRRQRPTTLLLPWRRDAHADHRAASALGRAANGGCEQPARLLEYPVWHPERGAAADAPQPVEAITWRLDIGAVVQAKLRAVSAHRSQCGGVIDDDPTGFTLPASMLSRCAEPWELYYELVAQPQPQPPKEQ